MKQVNTIRQFLKRNAVYMVLALCVLAIGLSITLVMVNSENPVTENASIGDNTQVINNPMDVTPVTEPTDDLPTPVDNPTPVEEIPVVKTVTFVMPVANFTSVEDYTDTLAYNSTLKRFQAHKAMDFFAEDGADVFAVYDGVISNIETTLLTGTTVTVDHGNGLYTVYNSLADGDSVFVGQTVKQGAKIGAVSVSNRQESAEGAHLHFQVIENGSAINPVKYLSLEEK